MSAKISIIVPVYNTQDYIARALDSLLMQSFKDIEIVIVDDRGNDKSMDIVLHYAKQDSRIQIVQNSQNFALFYSRYAGVKWCKGEYVLFLDSDDFLDEQACEFCYNALFNEEGKKQDIDMLCFNMNFQYNENEEYQIFGPIINNEFLSQKDFIKLLLQNCYYYWNVVSKMYKREFYLHTFEKYFLHFKDKKLQMAEDCLNFVAFLKESKTIKTLSEALYFYCFNPGSTMNTQSREKLEKNIRDLKLVSRKILSFAKDSNKNFEILCRLYSNDLRFNAYKEEVKLLELYEKKKFLEYEFAIKNNERIQKNKLLKRELDFYQRDKPQWI